MKITMAAEYAIRCILYLSKKGQGVLTSRQEIAENANIPDKFLAKIAQDLARKKIISIKQGAKGGYQLRQNPEEISMLRVVEVIIGEISLNDCTTSPEICPASIDCSANMVWNKARDLVRQTLRDATFDKLAKQGSCCTILSKTKRNSKIIQ